MNSSKRTSTKHQTPSFSQNLNSICQQTSFKSLKNQQESYNQLQSTPLFLEPPNYIKQSNDFITTQKTQLSVSKMSSQLKNKPAQVNCTTQKQTNGKEKAIITLLNKVKGLSVSNQQPQTTLKLLDQVLKIDSNNEEAYLRKAIIFRIQFKDYSSSLECCDQLIKCNSGCAQAYLQISLIKQAEGRYLDALDFCNTSLKYDNNLIDAWIQKAEIQYWNLQNRIDALNCYEQILRIDPHFEAAYIKKSIILRYDLQRYEEATECLNLLLEINAYNSECYIQMAEIYKEQSLFLEADNWYFKGLEKLPDNIELLKKKAEICRIQLMKYENAIECYERLLQIDGTNRQIQLLLLSTQQQIRITNIIAN